MCGKLLWKEPAPPSNPLWDTAPVAGCAIYDGKEQGKDKTSTSAIFHCYCFWLFWQGTLKKKKKVLFLPSLFFVILPFDSRSSEPKATSHTLNSTKSDHSTDLGRVSNKSTHTHLLHPESRFVSWWENSHEGETKPISGSALAGSTAPPKQEQTAGINLPPLSNVQMLKKTLWFFLFYGLNPTGFNCATSREQSLCLKAELFLLCLHRSNIETKYWANPPWHWAVTAVIHYRKKILFNNFIQTLTPGIRLVSTFYLKITLKFC